MPVSTLPNGQGGPVLLMNGTKLRVNPRPREDVQPDSKPRADLPFTTTSYPSNCLQFLKDVSTSPRAQSNVSSAKLKLDIIVVGAGLGGLATAVALARRGHKVRVFEQTAQLGEVGAGIQIPPNSGKLLERWGVIAELGDQAVRPDGISFRRWESGERIGYTDLTEPFVKACGAPYYVVHRAHLHSALLQTAKKLGVSVVLNARVEQHDTAEGSVTLENGKQYSADLIVAADGIKSVARNYVSRGHRTKPAATDYAVYRATVDVNKMREIPEVCWLLQKPGLNTWIGEDRHVMTYTIAAGDSFNMVLSHKDCRDPSTWARMTQQEILSEMTEQFAGWDEDLLRIMKLIDTAVKWPLIGNNSLDSWVSPSSRLVVLGDAAHAMVPYMSQGAAMAVEDGAALAVALNKIRSPAELGFALEVFERERKTRTSMMQEASMVNAMIWHFPDGPEQRARDAAMVPEVEGRSFQTSPNQWSDPVTRSWAYGYDAEEVLEKRWEAALRGLITGDGAAAAGYR
ncbi:FAD binding domain-containing protein [Plectosphaerella plurivora]|uniref:FAD binding domain-containing protein n=1 Tax=Plectosphaerella plurivora TaxID=936078 RepID=A0A9P8VFZ7_9PEZI|nr:FAD binding domain-containing protein [Plectosphaerella plurivora]